jgi:hypothetical protein
MAIKRDKSKDLNSVTASSDKSRLPKAPIPEKGGVSRMSRIDTSVLPDAPAKKKPAKKKTPVKKAAAKSSVGKEARSGVSAIQRRKQAIKDALK